MSAKQSDSTGLQQQQQQTVCSFQEGGRAPEPPLDSMPSTSSDSAYDDFRPIGARKKGRRKGCKNRPAMQRHLQAEGKKRAKNAKERKRVENIHLEYASLRMLLGDKNEKLSKLQVLNATIEYIKYLRNKLAETDNCNDQTCNCDSATQPAYGMPSTEEFSLNEFSLSPFCSPASSEDGNLPIEDPSSHLYQYNTDCSSHNTSYNLIRNDSYAVVVPCQNPQIPPLPAQMGPMIQPNTWPITPPSSLPPTPSFPPAPALPPPLSHYSHVSQ